MLTEKAISKILHQLVFKCDSVIIYYQFTFHIYLSHLSLRAKVEADLSSTLNSRNLKFQL